MLPHEVLFQKFLEWIKEDIPFFDVTSEIIDENKNCRAIILAKKSGIIAGVKIISKFYEKLGIKVKVLKDEGSRVKKGDIILEIIGNARKILMTERVILNLLSHMSGIATVTRDIVEKAKKVNPKIIIAATRKTLPGLRLFEKYAVKIGGGDTHRMSLTDMILIKDNHLKIIGDVEKAIKIAKRLASFTKKIEIEVSSLKDAIKAAKNGADIIMLDNMTPNEIKEVIETLKKLGLREKVLIEASGGITPENVEEYAKTGVDIISLGYLTHSAPALDISLEIIEVY